MRSVDIRRLWSEFRESPARKHTWTTPASLIVNSVEDPTTMFTTAGMQPLVPYLMGKPHPAGKRVYNIQGCIRTNDIEEVGDERHLTFFEMMGNRSLGDYFKKEAISRSREFLIGPQRLKLDPRKIAVTVFAGDADAPRDDESAALWQEVGMPAEKISYLGKKDNRRGPAGKTGPCGTDTEIFYRVGESEFPPAGSNVETDEDNWLEIWNNVFMAYYKNDAGVFEDLPAKNVDTGMGFERICMVLQHAAGMIDMPLRKATVYETDIFRDIIQIFGEQVPDMRRRRIIADHSRSAFFLIQEGLIPSNEGRGYVLRRLIRSMFFQRYISGAGARIALFETALHTVRQVLNQLYANIFTESIITTIMQEIAQFAETIHHGQKLLSEYRTQLHDKHTKILPGDIAFKLYDTYGFPLELTSLLLIEEGYTIDMDGYTTALEQARDRSRQGSTAKFSKGTDRASVIEGLPPTRFVGYDMLQASESKILKDMIIGDQRVLVFDITPFYAESGGQKGDTGTLVLESGERVQVTDVIKYGGVWLHFVS